MAVDYNEASATYDNSRSSSPELIDMFDAKVGFDRTTTVLDFGCGTGNHLHAIYERFGAKCYGVEPSDGMIGKARAKNHSLIVRKGDHSSIPFDDGFFRFIYMTDVIHHVPDPDVLFRNLRAKLEKDGLVCILTESHDQIDARWYNAYFASLASNEKKRYPDIPAIVGSAERNGFVAEAVELKPDRFPATVSDRFIRLVEEKNYSMFRLLDETEYREGIERLKKDRGRFFGMTGHGETLVWLAASTRGNLRT